MGRFGIGQPVRRTEDARLVSGNGRYMDGINVPGQTRALFVRSPHAHAEIRRIDTAAAAAAPGVVGVLTGADYRAAGYGPLPCEVPVTNKDGTQRADPPRWPLTSDRVRYVGDSIAVVVAETLAEAKDAAERIEVDYAPLPAVVDTAAAVEPGAPEIWDQAPRNVCFDYEIGDKPAVEAAFARGLEIDADTGLVEIVRYTIVDDFGKMINPLLVAGQVHGGTAQGIGQAMLEGAVFDADSGQLLSGSFMDYCMPRADNLPSYAFFTDDSSPCRNNPFGMKGCGEASAIGATPAVVNAALDALGPLGVRAIDMPLTPERVWWTIPGRDGGTVMKHGGGADFDLGARLRVVRKRHGLSQRALAGRAGLTNGTISLIEKNKVSPSVNSLKKVLDGIPMLMSEFFSGDHPPDNKVFYSADELTETARGPLSMRQVGANLGNRRIQMTHEFFEPGAGTGEEMARLNGDVACIVVRGRLEAHAGGERRILGPGDALYFEAGLPHRVRNLGSKRCELVCALTPPAF